MSIPSWIQNAVFYQIFPDRFYNGNTENDPSNVKEWKEKPTFYSFFGGDIEGIIQKMDYLQDLGVNAIYLNPIFLSPSPHGYNASDYLRIDPKLGTEQNFKDFINLAHKRNMHVILDGVFNHTGRGFFAFADILENGENSPYLDWYHIHHFPLHAFDEGKSESYQAWFDIKSMPKLNTENPQVCEYIMQVINYWLHLGVDGWRLDVPNEIDDDQFWSRFQNEVKHINPNAYILGEIWHAEPRWIQFFDGLMNYPFRDALLGLLNGEIDLVQFIATLREITTIYPWENVQAMYVLLGSHDTERLYTKLNGDLARIKLAFMLQFFFPGVPAVYYGDEIGMQGGKDPECRAGFIWDENQWNKDLRGWLKKLIQIRKNEAVLQQGCFAIPAYDAERKLCIFERQLGNEKLILAVNFSEQEQTFQIDADTINRGVLEDIFSGKCQEGTGSGILIELNALSGSLYRVHSIKEKK
jgi:neopullulanase